MSTQVSHAREGTQQPRGYRAISALAVMSLVFGVLSLATPLSWFLAVIPAVGIVFGRLALLQIRADPGERSGRGLALTGIGLSLVFWALGYGWLTFAKVSEVPFGHEEITYKMLQPGPGEKVPPTAFDWQDKKVFFKGFIVPSRQQIDLKRFLLCPSIPGCPYCTPDPKPTEMVLVELEGDLTVDYTTHEAGVAGQFHVDPESPRGLPYLLRANYFRSPP